MREVLTAWLSSEAGRRAVAEVSAVGAEGAKQAVRSLSRVSLGSAVLLPSVGAFAVGALVGASLGVLLAPRSGRETRLRLARAVGEGWSRLTGRRDRGIVTLDS